jgi:phosphoribosylformylglycinamidine cyclo-ligase
VLSKWGGFELTSVEGTWNLGLGQALVVSATKAEAIAAALNAKGFKTWLLGSIETAGTDLSGYVQGAKGVDGGAVRLIGTYAD